MTALLLLLAACARPVGDLGRAAPDTLHDTVMPTLGRQRALLAGEPVSNFNRTDQEREMHARIWRFLVAPRTADWFADTAAELRRTRLTDGRRHAFRVDAYYNWLHGTHYESSKIRYATLADDVTADLDTLPATFAAVCAVRRGDRQRAIASRAISGLDAATASDVAARRTENEAAIGWFTAALRDRYRAYQYALDHLLVETPHPQGREADELLADLAVWVGQAAADRFCGGGQIEGPSRPGHRIPSRYSAPRGLVLGS